jgi:hypothetical protein
MFRRARDKVGLAEGLHALGSCFARIGYYAHALEHLHQALTLCREIGDRCAESQYPLEQKSSRGNVLIMDAT